MLSLHKSYIDYRLLILILVGVLIHISGMLWTDFHIADPNSSNILKRIPFISEKCRAQREYRIAIIDELEDKEKKYTERIDQLKKLFPNPSQFGRKIEWSEIEELEGELKNIVNRRKNFESLNTVRSGIPGPGIGKTIFLSFGNIIFLSSAHILLYTSDRVIFKGNSRKLDIAKVYFLALLFICLAGILRDIYTSILTTEKPWVGWGSFCISTEIWIVKNISFIGFEIVGIYPFALAYILTSKTFQPKVNLLSKSINCGLGHYILFIQSIAIATCIVLFLPIIIALKGVIKGSYGVFPPIYLLDYVAISSFGLLIVVRTVMAAVRTRLSYWSEIDKLEKTWAELKELDLPPDPTREFLGQNWWTLPASLTAIGFALWALVTFLQLDSFFANILR